ncbi:MAG: hypothetical protein EBZ74_00900 [Planctomycetia bacterium]|nr:hypothetical protein [Planctomycetia bacterium]
MIPFTLRGYLGGETRLRGESEVPHVVVVDPRFDCYAPLAASARLGRLQVHFRATATEALKLARRLRVDAWLVAPELEDMAGADFVDLLGSQLGTSRVALVETAKPGSPAWEATAREAAEAGADATLCAPITFHDLEALLGLPAEARGALLAEASPATSAFVTLPVGVSAAVIAIAVLMLS